MATTADFRNGLCIEFQGKLYVIVSFLHVKPGKGGAFVRTKLKNITTGRIVEHTFTAGVKIQTARVERRACQFLYQDATSFHFMDSSNFESFSLPKEQVEGRRFLKEGASAKILFHTKSSAILRCELPPTVWLSVVHTEEGAKGNTATKAMKPATLEGEAEILVPLFINIDDIIKVDTRTGTYVERKKTSWG